MLYQRDLNVKTFRKKENRMIEMLENNFSRLT